MDKAVQQKIAALKKMAAPVGVAMNVRRERVDSLSVVFRSKKDGEDLMAQIESVVTRERQKGS